MQGTPVGYVIPIISTM